ncbi:hypothetical protein APHAL10511_007710 [Amanita phalloides]|nr:hypothetical protein APHAL10511_007710 [Amanita phalloides]
MKLLALTLAAIPVVLGTNFDVIVGLMGTFTYTPTEVHPAVDDTVTFRFVAGNHTATTTTFNNPCPPPAGGVGLNAFDTGFRQPFDNVTITIRDTSPHWVSCRQPALGGHCHLGMTMVINPTPDMTEAQFRINAMMSPASGY